MSNGDNRLIVIAFSGYKGSGKDFAEKCLDNRPITSDYHDRAHINFAFPLKSTVSTLFNVQQDYLELPEYKEKVLIEEDNVVESALGLTPRKLLQDVGQMFRDKYPGIWPKIWQKYIESLIKNQHPNFTSIVTVTDLRYPDELEILKKFNYVHFHIERPSILAKREAEIPNPESVWHHESESHIEYLKSQSHCVIINELDVKDLSDRINYEVQERFTHVF